MVSKELRQQIEDYAAQNRRSLVEDLKALVRIPSVDGEPLPGKPLARPAPAPWTTPEKGGELRL